MNILKLAKHLKEFTLDEINMIAEYNVENELKQLLNSNKISFQQGVYKYVENSEIINYEIFAPIKSINKNIKFSNAINYFMQNHAKKYCTVNTMKNYNSIFKIHILPVFYGKRLNEITINDIKDFYYICRKRNLCDRRLKNILALLNQLIRYYQNLGVINNKCNFQVRRLTSKNEFSINRIIFKGD